MSEHTRREALGLPRLTGVDITVIRHRLERYSHEDVGADERRRTLATLGLEGRFVLAVGRTEPRKNHRLALHTLARLGRPDLPLVIAGPAGPTAQALAAKATSLGVRLRLLGHLDDTRTARPLPVGAGAGHAVSRRGLRLPGHRGHGRGPAGHRLRRRALPEVGGDAALYVSPRDQEALATHLAEVLDSTALHNRLAEAGRRRALGFRWEDAARATLDVWKRVLASRSGHVHDGTDEDDPGRRPRGGAGMSPRLSVIVVTCSNSASCIADCLDSVVETTRTSRELIGGVQRSRDRHSPTSSPPATRPRSCIDSIQPGLRRRQQPRRERLCRRAPAAAQQRCRGPQRRRGRDGRPPRRPPGRGRGGAARPRPGRRARISYGGRIGLLSEARQKLLGAGWRRRLWPFTTWVRRRRLEPASPAWVSAAALLTRRGLFRKVGRFDEGFFMYLEDADLCDRIRRTSFAIAYLPSAEVVHRRGVSVASKPGRTAVEYRRSQLHYYRKHHGRIALATLRGYLLASFGLRLGLARLGHRPRGLDPAVLGEIFALARRPPSREDDVTRIGIDARKLGDFGIGTYIRALVTELDRLGGDERYTLFVKPAPRRPACGWRVRMVTDDRRKLLLGRALGARRASRAPAGSTSTTPPTTSSPGSPPARPSSPSTTSSTCGSPEHLGSPVKRLAARVLMTRAARQEPRLVLTVSEASRRDIITLLDVPPERVVVAPNAVDPVFFAPVDEPALAATRARHGLAGAVVLYVGNIKPHKNLDRLLTAFARVRQRLAPAMRLQLVLAGAGADTARCETERLRPEAERLGIAADVRWLGMLPLGEVARLYRVARVLAMPSLYEGFGLPVIEAMAAGAPVLTSNVSSLAEVSGDAALTVDPRSVDAIAEGLERLLVDEALATALVARGRRRAREFSWERTARTVLEAYRRVAAG